jgi:hypothetical protein
VDIDSIVAIMKGIGIMILAIACCVQAIRFLFKICDWIDYVEKKANHKYIQCSPKILEIMLTTLQYKIYPITTTFIGWAGLEKKEYYGIEWIQQDSYGRENSILIYGRTRREQEKMNSIVMKALQKKRTANVNKKVLANDATIEAANQIKDDIQRIVGENLRAAQEAARKNQEIMERLSGTSASRGGAP